ncbi:MAG: VIT1/CCC1 transporter family protein [Thermoplasmatota archaeon]
MLEDVKRRIFQSEGESIAQRYIVLNGFDGILTVLGITVGAFSAQVDSPIVLITSGLGAAVGLLISGISGAYITEKAQRLRKFKELQSTMISDMKGSIQEKKVESESVIISLMNGFSPFIFAALSVVPFFLARAGFIDMINTAYYFSMGTSIFLLALLGGFLGKIAKESIPWYALKMIAVGGVTAVIMYVLGLGG